jgi:serine/threonine protein kinase
VTIERDLVVEALPAYEILGELGRGGWGVVLEARHRFLGREVAIKQLPRAFGADPEVRSRFVAEARLLASLDHPHIVPVYDYVEREGLCLLVMEKLTGGTVWSRFTRGDVTPETACGIGVATALALHAAHERGILHRDVKPENLMFSANGVLKVTDFGIAKVLAGGRTMATRAGDVLGTPAYMAPEQAMGHEVGPAVDIYALGVVLFELLAGRLPFAETDGTPLAVLYQHVNDQPPELGKVASVPDGIARVVMQALRKKPAERFADARTFALEITRAAKAAFGFDWVRDARIVVAAGALFDLAEPVDRPPPPPDVAPGSLRELGAALRGSTSAEARHLASEVERLQSGAHELRELQVLQQHRSGESPFARRDWEEVERLLGAYGTRPTQRLGLPDDADAAAIGEAARATCEKWQRRAESPLSSRQLTEAARVLVRTCEGLIQRLTPRP